MAQRQKYSLIYAPSTKEHLKHIDKKYYSFLRDTISERLSFEPTIENRNRKPLTRTAFEEATWELRCGPENSFRIFYDVKQEEGEVHILAIGVKQRERLYIGGEEIEI
jgi:mRNA-degrading endonuclease RelE of RelBE toxin-antitoxin system